MRLFSWYYEIVFMISFQWYCYEQRINTGTALKKIKNNDQGSTWPNGVHPSKSSKEAAVDTGGREVQLLNALPFIFVRHFVFGVTVPLYFEIRGRERTTSLTSARCASDIYTKQLGPVVRRQDSAIHQINPYPVDKIYTNSIQWITFIRWITLSRLRTTGPW